jgi:Ca2+-binding EF-hand superfamily protein
VDDNINGKWEEAELRGEMLAPIKQNFAALDGDKDGALNPQEVGKAMQQMQEQRVRERNVRRSGGARGQD